MELELSTPALTLKQGSTGTVTATTVDDAVIWTSSNPDVATVAVVESKLGSKTVVVTSKGKGSAMITAISADGKNGASCKVTVTEGTTSIEDNKQEISAVYPNADGTFTIETSGNETCNITVANMNGQVVKRETMQGGSHIINIANQPAGVYVFVVDNGKQKTTARIIKN